MENLWITNGDELVEWVADLGAADPHRLMEWLHRVLTAGERHEVYSVREAPLAGLHSGSLLPLLRQRFEQEGVLDLGHFASSGMRLIDGRTLRVAARMAYVDARGEVVEDEVENLGSLLRALRPADVPISAGLMVDCPPLDVSGPLIDFRHPERSIWRGTAGRVRVRFSLRTDIWFPLVIGFLADTTDVTPVHDNRPQASRHTPRLNAFLAEVRAATLDLGGSWDLDEEIRYTRRDLVSAAGVVLLE
ncbi:hypothetical protein [Lentzea sp. NPDC051838]|uniref:hypothetical protein n=1 Tax=Lentzea sp. NPDC051838 TaxID=3154849 RepID=UPI0034465CC8